MRRQFTVLFLLITAACSNLPRHSELGPVERESAAVHIEQAQAEIAAGDHQVAVDRLIALRSVRRLPPDQRLQVEELLMSSSETLLSALEGPETDSGDYIDLYESNLAPRLKARAGLKAAERMLAEGNAVKAFKQVKRVERDLSVSVDRAQAGDIVGQAGLQLINRPGRYSVLFRYSSRGREALEFLVLRYPFDGRCPEAYTELVRHYKGRGRFDLAIERAEDLIIYHPDEPLTITMQAYLPKLRLERLQRDDYDRSELTQTELELQVWLERYAGRKGSAEDEAEVRSSLVTTQARLAESDLVVARFYDRVDEPQGVRLHAERALDSARKAGATTAIAEAERLIARHAEASAPAGGPVP